MSKTKIVSITPRGGQVAAEHVSTLNEPAAFWLSPDPKAASFAKKTARRQGRGPGSKNRGGK